MADISQFITRLELATRGEDVRDAIIGALQAINDQVEQLQMNAEAGES